MLCRQASVEEALDIVELFMTPAIIAIGVNQLHHIVKPVGPASDFRREDDQSVEFLTGDESIVIGIKK